MTKYSNPRTEARIENWPSGNKRVTAVFSIEVDPKRGERAVRTTTGAPKKLTYAIKVRFVTGDDGRLYVAELTTFGSVSVMKGDFKYQHEHIDTSDPRHAEVLALFNS